MILAENENPTLQNALFKNYQVHPDKKFIIHRQQSYTYSDVFLLTNGFADFLNASEVGDGDKVCLILPRVPELIIAFLGAVKAGAVPVPVNYSSNPSDIEQFLQKVKPSVIVAHEDYLHLIETEALSAHNFTVVVVGSKQHNWAPWQQACQRNEQHYAKNNEVEKTAYLNYTTGTSGLPKGAIASHSNIYWNTRSAVEVLDLGSDDVHLCMFAPFAHPHELFVRALYTGASLVLLEEINPKTIVKTINKHSVTCMMGLAPMYDMITSHCRNQKIDSLRFAESGGMFTRPDILKNFRKNFGIPILAVWGSTETSGIALANRLDDFREDGSIGKPCPYYEVKIIDQSGEETADKQVGEMIFRGKGVISGYDDEAPLNSKNGWYHSGDMVQRDEEGYYHFAERKSGLIKVAGLKVYPLQVENILYTHPSVREAAVIGVFDPRRGMMPQAFLVPEDGCELNLEMISEHCKGRLAPYMIPKKITLMDELPKVGSGKIDKKVLNALD